jgi:hypothetical protein
MKRTWDPTIPAVLAAIVMLVGTVLATGGIAPGQWRAEAGSDPRSVRIHVRLAEGNSQTNLSTDVDTAQLDGFDAATFGRSGAPLKLAWKRDAGTFVLEGEGGRRPGGKVRFEPNAAFGERWHALGFGNVDEIDFLRMAVHNVRIADAERLRQLGYDSVDADTLIRLESEPGSMESLEQMQAQGLHLALDDLFRLRVHGVSMDEVRAFQSTGAPIDVDGMLRLHAHGVRADYVAQVHESGYSDVDDLLRLHDQGVDADYVRGLVQSHLQGMTLDDVVRLHAHGVPADYARAIVETGSRQRDADDVIRLHNHGVSAEFVQSLAQAGHGDLAVDEVIRAQSQRPE